MSDTGDEPKLYPEHEKLAKVADVSQVCGEFLDWVRARYALASAHIHTEQCYRAMMTVSDAFGTVIERTRVRRTVPMCGFADSAYLPENPSTSDLLAEFFEIDGKKLEEEKRAMLEANKALEKG